MRAIHPVIVGTVVLLSASAVACHDSTAPTKGTLEVRVQSTGSDVDPDGYLLRVDGGPTRKVTANATIAFEGLPPGDHAVRLDDLASNCTAAAVNPQVVSIVAGETVTTDFPVECVARTGTIRLSITTTGTKLDADGYRLSVDGGQERVVAVNDALTFTDIHEGSHRLRLSGVADNCTLAGAYDRTVTVDFGGTTAMDFFIACSGRGTLQIAITTTGLDPDPDGYTVYVTSNDYYYGPSYSAALPTNGTVSIPDIVTGDYSLSLGGVAVNCQVVANNFSSVVIHDETVTSVSLNVVCSGKGTLTITTTTTGVDLDADGYTVTVRRTLGGDARTVTVPTNGSVSLSSLVGGAYVLTVAGWSANCEVTDLNPRQIAVSENGTTSADVHVACLPIRRLAFSEGTPGDIYTINSNGTDVVRLTTSAATDDDPAWSPDGSKIAFVTNRDGNSAIYVMNADGSDQKPLTSSTVGEAVGQPAWSPDGRKIAFKRVRDADAEIYVMNADGSGVVRLTQSGGFDGDPAWSPDGKEIVFRSDRSGSAELYVMSADGTSVTRLTTTVMDEGEPAWSPDGTTIAFVGRQCDFYYGCFADLYVMNADGSGVRQLTFAPMTSSPAWSPDGIWIAFAVTQCAYRDQCGERLSMVKANGSAGGSIREGHALHPAWRP